ncbi:MAG: protein kinase [Akkermansiaceae bacterium]|nr:protein kinase [Akkermansiaceae bacterium]
METFIAQGGMGAVYRARQISLDRSVAIKILPREFGDDPQFRASFQAEAKAMARLNHPNLISIYDFGEIHGMLFLIMECVEGKSLFHSSYGKRIDPKQAAEIVIAICRGLDHAHSADILHRDVKPSNILLSPNATPKIGDFGLATPINETASKEDIVYGTPGYTAPEIIHRLQVDRRADIFSTGVILHELLTGALPDDNRTPPSMLSSCPAAFDHIVARSTHPDPQQRYSTAAEFADDLENALKGAASHARLNLTGAPIAAQAAIPAKKSRALATTLCIIGVIALALILYSFSQKNDPSATPSVAATPTDTAAPDTPNPPITPTPDTPNPPITATPDTPTRPVTPTPSGSEDPPTPVSHPTRPNQAVQQALAQLKEKLANGSRDEFPEGTEERNGSHFLLLHLPLSWQAATRFAEEHGGHLAIAASQEDKEWMSQTFRIPSHAWLGAGIAGQARWQWLDDTAWNPVDQMRAGSDEPCFATLTPNGTLAASAPDQTHGFILQWRNDGSNPCTLDAQLKRTVASIQSTDIHKARYPVGTRTFEKSHFLLIPRSMSWENAYQFAKSQQAQLAVPSSRVESQWIISNAFWNDTAISYWLGGYLLKPTAPWQWITKEAWHSSGWSRNEPVDSSAHNRLLMTAASPSSPPSWATSEGEKGDAQGLLIEWSNPKQVTITSFDLNPWLVSVNRKIKERVKPDINDHRKNQKKLIRKYIQDMESAAKKIKSARQASFLVKVVKENMEKVEESGELPDAVPVYFPENFHAIHAASEKSFEKLDQDHEDQLQTQLDFYTQGLLKKATELEQSGFYYPSRILTKLVDSIDEDTFNFLEVLGL